MASSSSSSCGACGAAAASASDAALRCQGCLQVRYCDVACQRAAWPTHRVACKQEQARRQALEPPQLPPPRPQPRLHLRGAAMHPKEPSATIWIKVTEKRDASAVPRGMVAYNVQALNELLMRRARPGEEPDMGLVDGNAFIGLWSTHRGAFELPPRGYMRAVAVKSIPD